jgi:gliding motility-associated protein GldL
MNISEIVQSSGWKSFMAKLYGIGASVVIIGALFKIMHFPGAGPMLTVGLLTEAVIFFFSAFEPLHEELDWTLVYPELAGMTDPDDMEDFREESIAGRGVGLQKFDELFQQADIRPETIKNLSTGLNSLNQTATNLGDITAASLATKDYLHNMKAAGESVNSFSNIYSQSSGELTNSVGALASSYKKTAEMIDKSGQEIAQKFSQSSADITSTYTELSKTVKSDYSNITQGHKQFSDQLASLNKNLAELNTAYMQQVKGSQEHIKGSETAYKGMDDMMKNLKSSVDETQKYKEEISKLSQNLSELNNIYGNMLSAMSVISKK